MRPRLKLASFQPKEYDEAVTLFEWAKMMEHNHPVLKYMFATMNGLRLPIGLAVKASKAGMKPGVPDIWLPVPMYHEHGLVLELKRRQGGRLSPEQESWLEELRKLGWRAEVPAGAGEAISIIKEYLGI